MNPRTRRQNPETPLVNDTVAYLRGLGFVAWRQNVVAFKIHGRLIRAGAKGQSDVFCMLPPAGRLFVVECKHGTNTASPAQRDFLAAVTAGGGLAMVAYSLDEVDALLRKEGYVE